MPRALAPPEHVSGSLSPSLVLLCSISVDNHRAAPYHDPGRRNSTICEDIVADELVNFVSRLQDRCGEKLTAAKELLVANEENSSRYREELDAVRTKLESAETRIEELETANARLEDAAAHSAVTITEQCNAIQEVQHLHATVVPQLDILERLMWPTDPLIQSLDHLKDGIIRAAKHVPAGVTRQSAAKRVLGDHIDDGVVESKRAKCTQEQDTRGRETSLDDSVRSQPPANNDICIPSSDLLSPSLASDIDPDDAIDKFLNTASKVRDDGINVSSRREKSNQLSAAARHGSDTFALPTPGGQNSNREQENANPTSNRGSTQKNSDHRAPSWSEDNKNPTVGLPRRRSERSHKRREFVDEFDPTTIKKSSIGRKWR